MTKRQPIAVCTVCGKYSYNATSINKPCGNRIDKKKCTGVYGSALAKNDWQPCPYCNQTGCEDCQRTGWLFVRKIR